MLNEFFFFWPSPVDDMMPLSIVQVLGRGAPRAVELGLHQRVHAVVDARGSLHPKVEAMSTEIDPGAGITAAPITAAAGVKEREVPPELRAAPELDQELDGDPRDLTWAKGDLGGPWPES